MKICVIAPSKAFLELAGARIRYHRLDKYLKALGHKIGIHVIDEFTSVKHFRHDVYLFSKCYDSRSILIAKLLSKSNKLVGVDFFDDYFSQNTVSEFVCHREWIRSIAGLLDFYLCSTTQMEKVVSSYMPEVPSHILNDPFDMLDSEKIASTVEQNLKKTFSSKLIEVVWFGTGDNPHFAVGLADLFAFGYVLRALERDDFRVNLKILTNRRALTASGLEMLSRLPVPYTIDEWSIEKENAVLEKSLIAFIPVNAQNFSIVKSLNRAVTAMTRGCQVLSSGYPLYEPFNGFIYRDPEVLLKDITTNQLVIRKETLVGFSKCLEQYSNPVQESKKYSIFLKELQKQKYSRQNHSEQKDEIIGLIHGVQSPVESHKLAQRLKCLSISSPFNKRKLNYDVRFSMTKDGMSLCIQFDKRVKSMLNVDFHDLLKTDVSITGKQVDVLNFSELYPELSAQIIHAISNQTLVVRLANYQNVIKTVKTIMTLLFPEIKLYLSEKKAPYWGGELVCSKSVLNVV